MAEDGSRDLNNAVKTADTTNEDFSIMELLSITMRKVKERARINEQRMKDMLPPMPNLPLLVLPFNTTLKPEDIAELKNIGIVEFDGCLVFQGWPDMPQLDATTKLPDTITNEWIELARPGPYLPIVPPLAACKAAKYSFGRLVARSSSIRKDWLTRKIMKVVPGLSPKDIHMAWPQLFELSYQSVKAQLEFGIKLLAVPQIPPTHRTYRKTLELFVEQLHDDYNITIAIALSVFQKSLPSIDSDDCDREHYIAAMEVWNAVPARLSSTRGVRYKNFELLHHLGFDSRNEAFLCIGNAYWLKWDEAKSFLPAKLEPQPLPAVNLISDMTLEAQHMIFSDLDVYAQANFALTSRDNLEVMDSHVEKYGWEWDTNALHLDHHLTRGARSQLPNNRKYELCVSCGKRKPYEKATSRQRKAWDRRWKNFIYQNGWAFIHTKFRNDKLGVRKRKLVCPGCVKKFRAEQGNDPRKWTRKV